MTVIWGVALGDWDWPPTGAFHVPEEGDVTLVFEDLPKPNYDLEARLWVELIMET